MIDSALFNFSKASSWVNFNETMKMEKTIFYVFITAKSAARAPRPKYLGDLQRESHLDQIIYWTKITVYFTNFCKLMFAKYMHIHVVYMRTLWNARCILRIIREHMHLLMKGFLKLRKPFAKYRSLSIMNVIFIHTCIISCVWEKNYFCIYNYFLLLHCSMLLIIFAKNFWMN